MAPVSGHGTSQWTWYHNYACIPKLLTHCQSVNMAPQINRSSCIKYILCQETWGHFCRIALEKCAWWAMYMLTVSIREHSLDMAMERLHMGPLHKGLSLLIPHFNNSSYPCTKPISIAHQTFLSPPCHKKSPCFVRGGAHSASSRLK